MKKVIALFMLALMVMAMFTSCTTRSNIDVPSQRAEIFDKDGNRTGYMDIPASKSVLTWKDWTKGFVMGSLISGAVGSLISLATMSSAKGGYDGTQYPPSYGY